MFSPNINKAIHFCNDYCVKGHGLILIFNQFQPWKTTKEFLKIEKSDTRVFTYCLRFGHKHFILSSVHFPNARSINEVESFSLKVGLKQNLWEFGSTLTTFVVQ